MPEKFCDSCGAVLSESDKFCPSCGKKCAEPVGQPPAPEDVPLQQPPQAPPVSPPATATYAAPPVPYMAPPSQYSTPAQQPYYQPPQSNLVRNLTEPMTIGQYILTMIIMAIPIVGFIMMLVWAFSSDTNINKKNYARAALILSIIGIVLCFLLSSVLMAAISSLTSGYYTY